jgi:hypothetical protein
MPVTIEPKTLEGQVAAAAKGNHGGRRKYARVPTEALARHQAERDPARRR